MQRTLMFQDFMQDLRIGIRSLLRAPVLTLTIVVTVGIGLGATAAIFSAVNAALLRPLPYAAARRPRADLHRHAAIQVPVLRGRLPRVHRAADGGSSDTPPTPIARSASATATPPNCCGRAWCRGGSSRCSASTPMIGRDFSEAGRQAGDAAGRALRGTRSGSERLGGRTDAVGKPIRLDGAEYTLVGVLPPAAGPLERRFDLFLIQQFTPPPRKGPFFYSVIARLPAGADRALATSELRAINRALFPIWKASYQDEKATWSMEDLKTNLVGDVGTLAGLALAAVGSGVADRVRERLEPAHRARDQPAAGTRGARRARRLARPRAPLPARRKRGARRRRGRARRRRRVGRDASAAGARRDVLSTHAGDSFRCANDVADGRRSRSRAR